MHKEFTSTINDLTERGLSKESAELYGIFIKFAALSEQKIIGTLKLTDPDRNPEEPERLAAANMLVRWLRDKGKTDFTHNELADYIIQEEYYTFAGNNALGNILTPDEINILKELIMQKLDSDPSGPSEDEAGGDSAKSYRDPSDVGHIIETILKGLAETAHAGAYFVRLARSSGAYSDAHVAAKVGSVVSFVVPIDSHKLGYKTYSLEELATMGMSYDTATKKVKFG